MRFTYHPILEEMKAFYELPLSPKRFETYLFKLQGDRKGDIKLPIGGYNPMAKSHVLEKICELESFNCDELVIDTLEEVNKTLETYGKQEVLLVLNLADDLKGGWTHRFATDFDSKFKINALVERFFCAPYFWSSEKYSEDLIRRRTLSYAYRTAYWLMNSRLLSLEEHLNQEIYVAKNTLKKKYILAGGGREEVEKFYKKHKTSDDYSLIFNFFYGDQASQTLSYPKYGIKGLNGFDYAVLLS